ncbi:hypothetical protein PF005_g17994 [Phytophthora fragariae]|uniref:FAM21/CAPZIP domain-containing protein n=1 Tax=Phytophthora fragariae TaxID=53985 RepID=A0A6A3X209_9STRA|nr:hypothetical protein PF009_g18662 [Phytophthora fragariae]KAE9092248.1 hypothetical protein PF007_g18589 [Phytophthora fragariae]KAE9193626.1 hypothetical protein PF005_g17994 [Phytophthora fragariae]
MAEMLALEAAPGFESALALAPPPPPPSDDHAQPAADAPAPSNEKKTLADLARQVSSWTLHSDHELDAFLKQYSADLFVRTKDLKDSVRDIAAEADAAHVRLKNTFNQFLMLSNNQFIENRVYDEEQEDFFGVEAAPEKEKTEEKDKEKEEKVDATAESKDQGGRRVHREQVQSETSLEFDTVLDIYNERPLPFIIGTREFLEDETLGLGAAPEDYSDSDSDSSYGSSYSSSDSDSASDASSATREERRSSRSRSRSRSRRRSLSSESDESSVAAPPPRRRADSDESDTSGLFGRPPVVEPPRRRADSDESDTSGLFGRPSAPESTPPLPRTSYITANFISFHFRTSSSRSSRRRQVFDDDEDSEDSDWTSDSDDGKKTPKRKQSSASRREQDTPPPFAAPTPARKNQFFDSSDEESDAGLFGSAPTTTTPRVFATDEVVEPKQRPSLVAEQSSTTPMRRNSSKRLTPRRSDSFGSSSSDEEDGLFGSAKEAKTPTTQAPPQGFRLPPMGETTPKESKALESKKSFLSSDSDAESTTSRLFGLPSSAKDTKKYSAGASVLPPPQQSRRLDFSDDSSDDEDGGLFGATPANPTTPAPKPVAVLPTAAIPAPRRPTYSNSSSDDDDDGGLFGAKPKAAPIATPAPVSAPRQRPSQCGLLGEGDSDDSDDGGLFGASKPAAVAVPPPVAAARPPPVVTRDVSDSNSDDDDGGLFGVPQPSKPAATAPVAAPVSAPPQARQSRVLSDSSDSDDGAAPQASFATLTPGIRTTLIFVSVTPQLVFKADLPSFTNQCIHSPSHFMTIRSSTSRCCPKRYFSLDMTLLVLLHLKVDADLAFEVASSGHENASTGADHFEGRAGLFSLNL